MRIFEVTGVQYQQVDPNDPEFQQMRAQNAAARATPAALDPLKTDPALRALYDPKTLPTASGPIALPAADAAQNAAADQKAKADYAAANRFERSKIEKITGMTADQLKPQAAPVQPGVSNNPLIAAANAAAAAKGAVGRGGAQQPAQPAASGQAYTVKPGDTLSKIATQMGTDLKTLLTANPQFQANPNLIKPGQTVNKPNTATVKPGTTVTTAPANAPKPPAAPAQTTPPAPAAGAASNYYVQPAAVGMNGETDYVVVDRDKGLEVKSFNSQAEADAWIKQQPVAESLDRILSIAGLK